MLSYKDLFEELDLGITFLVTPQTDEDRLRKIDSLTRGFVYLVSSAAITGGTQSITTSQEEYFKRICSFDWQHPTLIGFGIKDRQTFSKASEYANGAIIGSAFIRALGEGNDLRNKIDDFIRDLKD